MREQPKAEHDFHRQTVPDVTMVNPQLTDAIYFAGLWDGEGSFILARTNGNRLRAMVTIINTDPMLVSEIKGFLEGMKVPFYLGTYSSKGKSRRLCHQFNVNRYHAVKFLCEVLMPHLRGSKKAEAQIVHEWVERRIKKIANYVCTSVSEGYKPSKNRVKGPKHDAEDIAYLERLMALKSGSSET